MFEIKGEEGPDEAVASFEQYEPNHNAQTTCSTPVTAVTPCDSIDCSNCVKRLNLSMVRPVIG